MKLPVIILLLVFIVACGNNKQNAEKSVIIQPDKSEIVQIDKSDLNSMKNHPGKKSVQFRLSGLSHARWIGCARDASAIN